jgi:hypothetical protein
MQIKGGSLQVQDTGRWFHWIEIMIGAGIRRIRSDRTYETKAESDAACERTIEKMVADARQAGGRVLSAVPKAPP